MARSGRFGKYGGYKRKAKLRSAAMHRIRGRRLSRRSKVRGLEKTTDNKNNT